MLCGFRTDFPGEVGRRVWVVHNHSAWLVELSRLSRNMLTFLWQKNMCKNTSDFLIQFCKYKQWLCIIKRVIQF